MKIISPLINAKINPTKNGFFYTSLFRSHKTVPVERVQVPLSGRSSEMLQTKEKKEKQ